MKNLITKDDIVDFIATVRIFREHSSKTGVNKAIDLKIDIYNNRMWYVVSEHHKRIALKSTIEEAIEIYNII